MSVCNWCNNTFGIYKIVKSNDSVLCKVDYDILAKHFKSGAISKEQIATLKGQLKEYNQLVIRYLTMYRERFGVSLKESKERLINLEEINSITLFNKTRNVINVGEHKQLMIYITSELEKYPIREKLKENKKEFIYEWFKSDYFKGLKNILTSLVWEVNAKPV